MKLTKKIILAAAAVLVTSSTMAQLNEFTAGEIASAAEMNANFTMISDAFDELEARVAALEDAASDPSVFGRRYGIRELGLIIEQQEDEQIPPQPILVRTMFATAIGIYFSGADTGSLSYTTAESDSYGETFDPQDVTGSETETGIPFTWTQTGREVVIDLGEGETYTMYTSKDGTNISQFFQEETATRHEVYIWQGNEIDLPPSP